MDIEKLLERVRRESGVEIAPGDPIVKCVLLTEAAVDAITSDAVVKLREAIAAAGTDLKAQAELRPAIIDSVADRIVQTAGRSLRTMTRTSYLWAAAAAVGAALLALMTGVELGFIWGTSSTTRVYQHADATVHAVAVEEGPKAVEAWDKLMRLNPIMPLLAECTDVNLAVGNGETGCHVWIRTGQTAVISRSR